MPKGRKGLYPGFKTVRKRLPFDFAEDLMMVAKAICMKDREGAIVLVEKMFDS